MDNDFINQTPESIAELSQEEATIARDDAMRAARSDPKHPYLDANSLDHRRAVENMAALYEVATDSSLPQGPMAAAIEEAMNPVEDESVRNRNLSMAETLKTQLENRGFDVPDLDPDEITKPMVDAMHVQLMWDMAAEGDESCHQDLCDMLGRMKGITPEQQADLGRFRSMNPTSPEAQELAQDYLSRIIHPISKG